MGIIVFFSKVYQAPFYFFWHDKRVGVIVLRLIKFLGYELVVHASHQPVEGAEAL